MSLNSALSLVSALLRLADRLHAAVEVALATGWTREADILLVAERDVIHAAEDIDVGAVGALFDEDVAHSVELLAQHILEVDESTLHEKPEFSTALAQNATDVARSARDGDTMMLRSAAKAMSVRLMAGPRAAETGGPSAPHALVHEFWPPEGAVVGRESFPSPVRPRGTGKRRRHSKTAEEFRRAPPPPAARYSDCTLWAADRWGGAGTRLTKRTPLRTDSWYDLEVAVREKPTGIEFKGPRPPLCAPAVGHQVKLLVAFAGDGVEIDEPLASILLPAERDSVENARVRFRPKQTSEPDRPLAIRIKIYYELNLLESLTLRAQVLAATDEAAAPRKSAKPSITVSHDDVQQDFDGLEYVAPKRLNIDIGLREDGYELTFLFRREGRANVEFHAPVRLSLTQLESSLLEIRKALFSVAASPTFAVRVDGTPAELQDQLDVLAQAGRHLWSLLFQREDGALREIGALLSEHPLPDGSYVQIVQDRGTERFVVPWSILYDRDVAPQQNVHASADGLWGFRYVIEQRSPQVKAGAGVPAKLVPPDPELGIMLWPFAGSDTHVAALRTMVQAAGGTVKDPINQSTLAMKYLAEGRSDVVYVLTHGHTQFPNADRYGFSDADFVRAYDNLPSSSPLRAAWSSIRDDIQNRAYDSDRSWIGLEYGKLFLDDLYGKIEQLPKRPVVILNMCDSAQVTPALDVSFIHFFLSRKSRAVIGTECAMRPVFSQEFCSALIRDLLNGVSAGEALLSARRACLARNNPLGLAFTLFGLAGMKFEISAPTASAPLTVIDHTTKPASA